jgi:hypothetical protein
MVMAGARFGLYVYMIYFIYQVLINFEEKVCMQMKEMGVMDTNPDELRGWMMMTSDNDVYKQAGVCM